MDFIQQIHNNLGSRIAKGAKKELTVDLMISIFIQTLLMVTSLSLIQIKPIRLKCINIIGQKVFERKNTTDSTLSLTTVNKGVYLVK
jgi:hypothetical protein